jgi:hypothetical protein
MSDSNGSRKRAVYITLAITILLAGSTLILPFSGTVHSAPPMISSGDNSSPVPSATSIINSSYAGSPVSGPLFSPFNYNESSPFFVSGNFVSFVFGYDNGSVSGQAVSGIQILDFKIDQEPVSSFSSLLFSQMTFQYASRGALKSGVHGSVFYAYSNSMLLLIHDDPQAVIQLYSFGQTVYTSVTLNQDIQPSSKLITPTIQGGFSGMTYDNGSMGFTGYLVSSDSNLTINQSNFFGIAGPYQIQTSLPPSSYLTSFQLAAGVPDLNYAMNLLAQGVSKGTVTYFASAAEVSGSYGYEMDYNLNGQSVLPVKLMHNDIRLSSPEGLTGSNGTTAVFLFSGNLLNATSAHLSLALNGVVLKDSASLAMVLFKSSLSGPTFNVTDIGRYTMVAVYTPGKISSFNITSNSNSPSGIVGLFSDTAIPLSAAVAIVAIAAFELYRRKST